MTTYRVETCIHLFGLRLVGRVVDWGVAVRVCLVEVVFKVLHQRYFFSQLWRMALKGLRLPHVVFRGVFPPECVYFKALVRLY